ncbi:MAG: M14 family zinc carboxypeptidase [Blastocatellia bacterium]
MNIIAQSPEELAQIWEKQHISKKFPSNVRHADLKKYLEKLAKSGVKVEVAGRSLLNREIYQIEFGKGPLKVFLWSQMHGDEPTATSALIDMFFVLQENREKDWVEQIESRMTIRAVPMMNPDGADLYQRRSSDGIDINRDARNLLTPEARLLKKLRDEWSPEIGFNLHNQNALTTVGKTFKQAAISFLVVFGDAEKTTNEKYERNKRLVTAMSQALQKFIPGHIGRYGDEWTPSAFGDSFSSWGTAVILIETGALHGKDEMFLVKMNFVAFLTAITSLVDSREKSFSSENYDLIPENTSGKLFFTIFRNANIIDRMNAPYSMLIADLGINKERRRAEFTAPSLIRQIGDLSAMSGLDEYDASGFNVVGRFMPIKNGNFAELLFYKKDRKIDWSAVDLEKQFPPDAIFSVSKWIKGEGVIKRVN